MEVKLSLQQDYLEVFLKNTSAMELHLWELDNSWGYWSIYFQLRSEQGTDIFTVRQRQDTEFTINGPNDFGLAPNESRKFSINLNDGWWEFDQEISSLKNKFLYIRANYSVDFTLEAEKYGIFMGSAASNWEVSKPPHNWLFMEK